MRGRQVGKAAGLAREHREHCLGTVARSGERLGLVATRGDQDMGGLEEIGRTEAAEVVLVVAPAGDPRRVPASRPRARSGRGSAPPRRSRCALPRQSGLGLEVAAARLLQQQLADGERARGAVHAAIGVGAGWFCASREMSS